MAIWWIRRDLRLEDNEALQQAIAAGGPLIPLYTIDPHSLQRPAAKRHAFLFEGLHSLDCELRARGSRLVVRLGDPATTLAALQASGAGPIFAEEASSPFARRRDASVAEHRQLTLCPGLLVHHPSRTTKSNGEPYLMFTPYQRAWSALPPPDAALAAPDALPPVPAAIASDELPAGNAVAVFPASAAEAARRLRAFSSGSTPIINGYARNRDRLDQEATSQLSPYLRYGMVSARQMALAANAAASAGSPGAEAWRRELAWREYFHAILFHFPVVLSADESAGAWLNDPGDFAAWCDGRTGYPIVDAAMRQLVQTGWLHNRARMVVASFLVKDLLIDWRWGERFFMEHLIDGDAAANNGNWRWTAGMGAGAAPFWRVFNPTTQAKRFDPDGAFVRRWLPELERVPLADVHTPWLMSEEAQRQACCLVGHDYPAPMVDHALARRRALGAYGSSGRSPAPPTPVATP